MVCEAKPRGALDSGHPTLYVGHGGPSDLSASFQPFESSATVVGADVYPIGNGGTAQSVAPVASGIARLSAANGTASAMVLQAFSWANYPGQVPANDPRWPTETEMESMRNQALAINPG